MLSSSPSLALLRRYNVQGPRYTSYPTADRFGDAFGVLSLGCWLAVGLAFGWNVFFENTTSVVNYKGTDIYGNQDRTLNVWPVLANARWFPKISSNRDLQPYIGANVGGCLIPELAVLLEGMQRDGVEVAAVCDLPGPPAGGGC